MSGYGPTDGKGCLLFVLMLPLLVVHAAGKKAADWIRNVCTIIPPLP